MPEEIRLVQAHLVDLFKVLKQATFGVPVNTADRVFDLGKEYLKLLGNEIRVNNNEMRLSSIYAAMAGALCMSTKQEHFGMLPSIDPVWLPKQGGSRQWEELLSLVRAQHRQGAAGALKGQHFQAQQ